MQQVARHREAMRRFMAKVPAFNTGAPAVSSASSVSSPRANTELGIALRRVTHTECAAVPAEDLQKVVHSACESEEALAIVLRHVEANVAAPPLEWRRIHGALAILERLVRGRQDANAKTYDDECLVGRVWYEAKLEFKLNELTHFEHPEDRRIGHLIRRAATTARTTAEKRFQADQEDYDLNDSRFIPKPHINLGEPIDDVSSEKRSPKQVQAISISNGAEDAVAAPVPMTIGCPMPENKLDTIHPYNFTRKELSGRAESPPRSCCCWWRCFRVKDDAEEVQDGRRSCDTSFGSESDLLMRDFRQA